jgi:hypothetical protein
MEVIGHHRISHDTNAEEGLELPQEENKMFPFDVTEDALPVNDAGVDVEKIAPEFTSDSCLHNDQDNIA